MATIVMAHGAFCGGWAFEAFRAPFEARGWTVAAPDLRGHGDRAASEGVVGVSMADYATDLAAACRAAGDRVVLVGHSMGGLAGQMAAAKVELAALVLLAPSAPWGIVGASMEEAVTAFGVQMMGPFSSGSLAPDRTLMAHHCLDRMAPADREAVLARLGPESGRAVREALTWWFDPFMTTRVVRTGCPVLAVAGQRDVVHPPATVRLTAAALGAAYVEMPGMSHWLIGEPGWEDVASSVIDWLDERLSVAA